MNNRNHRNENITYNNVNTNHPLINNAQDYITYEKFVSINSEDRDITKYPKSNEFEIELPEDYLNVYKMSLYSWCFPSNYNTFSVTFNNLTMTFQINQPYNPNEYGTTDALQQAIFEALFINLNNNYYVTIEEGFYNPTQMTTELTNRFNKAVSDHILTYFTANGYESLVPEFIQSGGYQQFIIVYNNVGQKIWFGNRSSGFVLTNQTSSAENRVISSLQDCSQQFGKVPDYSNWGLPSNLGLVRCDVSSIASSDINQARFYYGDVFPGDSGYWLLPDPSLPNSQIHFLEPTYKINLMGPSHIYLLINGYNCIDETSPFSLSKFTAQTNQTNSTVNSCFAKIDVCCTPVSQYYDRNFQPYKLFYPPAERIRRLTIRLRYHDGTPVDFGTFNFSFMIQFELLVPQINRSINRLNYTVI
jgi:hypothetical protein